MGGIPDVCSSAIPPSLSLPHEGGGDANADEGPHRPPRLSDIVSELALIGRNDLGPRLEAWLDALDATGRWALLKLLTGALRVGVSARLAKTAVADMAGFEVDDIEEVWHGLAPPYEPLFAWLEGRAPKPDVAERAGVPAADAVARAGGQGLGGARPRRVFRRMEMGRHPRADRRRRAARRGSTRARATTSARAFPDVVDGLHFDAVLDGELLVVRDGEVGALQRPAAAPQPQGRDARNRSSSFRRTCASTMR